MPSSRARHAIRGPRSADGPLIAVLLLDGTLRPRDHLETLVGDRLAALDRQPVGAVAQALLGALDRGKLLAQLLGQALVELLVEQFGRGVGRVLIVVGELVAALALLEVGERALHARPLAGEQLARACR